MKIICTVDEQKVLTHILATNVLCPFELTENENIKCSDDWDEECDECTICVSKNIEWEIEDGD